MSLANRLTKLEKTVTRQSNEHSSLWWHHLRCIKRANCEHPKHSFRYNTTRRQAHGARSIRSFFCLDCGFEGVFWKTNLLSVEQALDLHFAHREGRQKGEEMECVFINKGLLSYFFMDDFEKISDELVNDNLHGFFSELGKRQMLNLAECYKNEYQKQITKNRK